MNVEEKFIELACGHKFTDIDDRVLKASKRKLKDFTCSECNFIIPLRLFKDSKNFEHFWNNIHIPPSNLVELYTTKDSICSTSVDYIHYNTLSEIDEQWGCAYRCLQMILSSLCYRGYWKEILLDYKGENPSTKEILIHLPNIYEIQISLAEKGNIKKKDVGTHLWIEPPNASFYLKNCCKKEFKSEEWVFHNPKYKFNKEEIESEKVYICGTFEELSKKLFDHFNTQKLPIMYDDSIKAFTLEGVRKNEEIEVLRFDPHEFNDLTYEYYKNKIQKGDTKTDGVSWMKIHNAFISKRYMITFPILKE